MRPLGVFVTILLLLTFVGPAWGFGSPSIPTNIVEIRRDAVGVPHVLASSTEGVYWGFGYVLARDRMLQLELLRRSVKGTLAEIFGPSFVETDFTARRDGIRKGELAEGLNRAPGFFRSALSGFTRGINAAISAGRRRAFPMDPGFAGLGIDPAFFEEIDVLEVFSGTMGVRYNDFSQELDNLHLLRSLVKRFGAKRASNVFEDVIFFDDPQVYSTLGSTVPPPRGIRHPARLPDLSPSVEPRESPVEGHKKRGRTLKSIGIPEKSGSYAAVLSNRIHGRPEAFLLGGPQMGYFKPSALYEVGLHTPEFDLVGTTPVGYFVILFGANRRIGFTATAGVSNLVDLIALKPDPTHPGTLSGDGMTTRLATNPETILVKGSRHPVRRVAEETEIGPVIARDGETVFTKQRGWRHRLVDSYAAWFDSNHARNLDSWLDASDRMALSINWLGADSEGHIGYVSCGVGKTRRAFGDDRLPTRRPTDFAYPDHRVAALDPKTGFFANWNCPPMKGFRNGDLQTAWGADQRTAFLAKEIERGRRRWSVSFLEELDRKIAFRDMRAEFFKDELIAGIDADRLSPDARRGLAALKEWDNTRFDGDGDGKFDHIGAGLFDRFWKETTGRLFEEVLKEFGWMIGSDSTWTQSALVLEALKGNARYDYLGGRTREEFTTKAFQAALESLASAGRPLPFEPCPPMEFAGVNRAGVPTQTSPATFSPFMNRGSDVVLIRLSPEGIEISGVLPPGNAAFGLHERDQMDDFRGFRYHRRPLFLDETTRLTKPSLRLHPRDETRVGPRGSVLE